MLSFLVPVAFAAQESPAPPRALAADNIDPVELRARAMAGLDHPDRRFVRWQVRNDLPVNALERRLAHQSIVLVHQEAGSAIWRVLDRRGTADWLRVELDLDGRLVDWTWLSEGMSASEKLADRAAGTNGARRRRDEVEELVLVAPADLPEELERLHARYPGEVWADLNALEPYYRVQDWVHFEAALDRVGELAGNDPWLEWLHACAAYQQGRKDEARLRKDLAISFDPTLANQAYTPGRTRHG